jgi:hypothetical protein
MFAHPQIGFVLHDLPHRLRPPGAARQNAPPSRICPPHDGSPKGRPRYSALGENSRVDSHAWALRVDHFRLPLQRQRRPPNSVNILQTSPCKVKSYSKNSALPAPTGRISRRRDWHARDRYPRRVAASRPKVLGMVPRLLTNARRLFPLTGGCIRHRIRSRQYGLRL